MISIAVVLCVAFAVYYFLINNGMNYADKPVNRRPLFAACAYTGSLAMLGGMARSGDFSNSFTKRMSRKNFGLYVSRRIIISG
ncbi:MAG: hypothetical protein IJT00_07920 [Lachnospiraceae bacterium]|nr:hypothetical protein [Lachnospiraceae bacterium]